MVNNSLIIKKIAVFLRLLIGCGILIFGPAFPSGSASALFAEELKSNAVYFYITGCVSCAKVDAIVKEAGKKTDISAYNVIDNDAALLFEIYCDKYNVPDFERVTPAIFAGPVFFMGLNNIETKFPEYIGTNSFHTEILSTGENTSALADKFRSLDLFGALLTGFLNGLNPCSLSILILFAALISARELKLLNYGLFYCAGKMLAYFGIGTVFFTFFSGIEIDRYLFVYRLVMTAVCLFFIVFNFSDFLAARGENYGKIKLQLPGKIKGLNFSFVKRLAAAENKALLPGICFAAGAVTSAGEFFCTGQIYIATILSMIHSNTGDRSRALLFLFVYSVGFILPFLAVTFALHKGAESFDVSDFIRRHTPHIKIFNVLIFTGILIFIWFF